MRILEDLGMGKDTDSGCWEAASWRRTGLREKNRTTWGAARKHLEAKGTG